MALFKIAKGNSANLETNRPTRLEGFIYLTQDDMKFHIDVGNGSALNLRRALNASLTDALRAWYTNPADTPGTWTVTIDDLLQEDLKDGLTIRVRLSTSYNDTFNTLNVNGFGKKVVYYRQNERLTSHLPQYAEVLLTYREAHQRTFNNVTYSIPGAATSAYIYNNVDYGTSGWVLDAAYSDGNNYDRILNQYERRRAGREITKYKLCMNDANGLLQPISIGDTTDNTKTANTVPLDPSRIIYYSQNGTTAAFGATAASVLYEDIPTSRIKYTINADLPTFSDLYLVGTFNADGLFVLDSTFYRIVTVPSSSSSPTLANNTFTQGKYYIYVGSTHGTANEMLLHPTHGIYYCEDSNGTKLLPVTHRPVYTRSSVGTIEHDSRTNEHLITKGALAYWNGAYSGTNSNLEYTKVGKLGSMATAKKGSWVVNRVAYAAADDQLNTASLLYTTGTNLAVNKNSITSGMTFEVNGKSAFYDDMYLSCTDDTAAESKSASFYLSYDNTSTNKSTSAVIRACGGGAQATSGMLQVTSMGAVAVTSGNAGGQLYSGNSDIAILSGAQIYLESNGMTEANRIGICIDSSGNVLPVKKEAANTNQLSLGSSTARWKALYIGEGDTIGSANKPIYWYNGVPTPIDITLMNGTAGKLAYYSNATTLNQYTADVGSARLIVYMNKGIPTAGNNTVAHLGNAGKNNMNEIGKLWPSTGMTSLSDPGNTVDNPMTGDTKSTSWHLYWDTSYSDDPSGSNPWVALIVNKAGTSQWWVRSKAGSTITNGSEWNSGWRHLVTSAQAGVGSGVKPIYINTSGEATASAENIGSSLTPMYLEGGEFKAIGVSLNTSSAATKLAYYSATGTISGLTATVGSGTLPVFIDGGYPKATTYSLGATINAGTANQVAYYSGANAISSKAPAWEEWIGGTSEGPKAKILIGNASYTSGAIPSAGSNASGVVNTTVLTFGGNKTFANNVIINGTSNFNNNTTTTGIATFNGNVAMNSSVFAESLTAGSLIVSGNTSLVNTTNTANLLPHIHNTYNIGSSSLKYINVYAANFKGNADTATKATQDASGNVITSTYATKTEMNNLIAAADAMIFKGVLNGAASTAYTPAADKGHTYKVGAAGLINGEPVEIGDLLICITDNTVAATSSNVDTVKTNWVIIQNNVDGAVFKSANTFTDTHVIIADGIVGKVKDSGYTIATSVPSGALFTDNNVTLTGNAEDKAFPILLKNTNDTTDETAGVKFSNNVSSTETVTKPFTYNPSTGVLKVPKILISIKDDSYGFLPYASNWNSLGSGSLYWYRAYVTHYYGTYSHISNWDAGKNIGAAATSSAAASLGSVYFYNTCAAGGTQTRTLLTNNVENSTNITVALPKVGGTLVPLTSSSTTDNAIARFDGENGAIQNSSVTIDDNHNIYTDKMILTGRYFHNVALFSTSGRPKEIFIKTKIPFTSGTSMPKIILHMYTYESGLPTEIEIVFYIYNNAFCNEGATSNTGHRPKITLCSYTENNNKYVGIALGLADITEDNYPSCYYVHFNVDFIDIWPNDNNRTHLALGWTIEQNANTTSIIPNTDRKTVKYVDQTDKAVHAASTTTQYGISYYSDVAGTFASTGAGTSGQYLKSNGTSAPTWASFPSTWTPSSHTHGNITNDGKVGSGNKLVVTSNGTITAGATIAAAISSLSLSTKFLREDGTWATPSYTTNTDAKVKQSVSASDVWRKVLLHYTSDNTSTAGVTETTNQVYAAQNISVNPSTGTLRSTEFNVDDHVKLHYDSTTASLQFIFE